MNLRGELEKLPELIESKEAKIAFIGLGQAGLPAAINLADKGFSVTGCDINGEKLDALRKGVSYSEDVSDDLIQELSDNDKFRVTDSILKLNDSDIYILAVPTFLTKQKTPDVTAVSSVAEQIVKSLKRRALIILESTIYPGATESIIKAQLDNRGLKPDEDYYLAYSPSRIDPGNENWPISKIPRIVGGLTKESLDVSLELYSMLSDQVVPATSIATAEMTKLYENSFRAINIAFVDKMHMICRAFDLDVWEIVDLASSKPFGFVPFSPGPGIGGECIPIVPLFTAWKAREYGLRASFIELASEIIDMMPNYFTEYLIDLLNNDGKSMKNANILLLGLAYKSDMADIRKSPAIDILKLLEDRGANVSYFDPFVPRYKENGQTLNSTNLDPETLKNMDAVIITTAHSKVDYEMVVENSKLILDTRNALRDYDLPYIYR